MWALASNWKFPLFRVGAQVVLQGPLDFDRVRLMAGFEASTALISLLAHPSGSAVPSGMADRYSLHSSSSISAIATAMAPLVKAVIH